MKHIVVILGVVVLAIAVCFHKQLEADQYHILFMFGLIIFLASVLEELSSKDRKTKEKSSLLYKPKEQRKVTTEIKIEDNKIIIHFWSDCGKFGTDEILDFYKLTPERLLSILQERNDYLEGEL